MTIEEINAQIATQISEYKDSYHKSKNVNGIEEKTYKQKMATCIKRLCELLEKKRELRETMLSK